MAEMMYRDAVRETIREEMARDESVVVLGEDVVGGMGTAGGPEAIGGIWSTSTGLFEQFGASRVIDTPISESAIVGTAGGLALSGKRPVAELMFADFIGVSLDQLWNQIGKFRYMFGGKTRCPAVIRMAYGGGYNAAAQHSQCVHQILTGMPGLKVVMPSTPEDVRGLLRTAIRGDDPVMFLEHKALYGVSGEVPEGDYTIPFGHARQVTAGEDVTVIATGMMVGVAEAAAERMAEDGIGVDLLDQPDGRGSDPRFGRGDRASGDRRRGPSTLQSGDRYCRAGCAQGVFQPACPGRDGHCAALARALRARAGAGLPAVRRPGRSRGSQNTRLSLRRRME